MTVRAELRQLRKLEIMSLIEGTTLVILVFVAVPLKHLAGAGTMSAIMGPVHGLAFLAYIWTVIETVSGGGGWHRPEIARLAAVSLVPFGSFTNSGFLKRKAAVLLASSRP